MTPLTTRLTRKSLWTQPFFWFVSKQAKEKKKEELYRDRNTQGQERYLCGRIFAPCPSGLPDWCCEKKKVKQDFYYLHKHEFSVLHSREGRSPKMGKCCFDFLKFIVFIATFAAFVSFCLNLVIHVKLFNLS